MNDETPEIAARRLSAAPIKRGFKPQALHEYSDSTGKTFYWRIRLKHPTTNEKWIRPMCQNEAGKFLLKEPAFQQGKPLYRLFDIASHSTETIWIVEGEWCADKLAESDFAVTTSGSADSAKRIDWSPLANRKIIIWRDNDDAGLRYAKEVTEQLEKLNCTVKWIDVAQLNLPPKGDCVDWLLAHPDASHTEIAALPLIPPLIKDAANKTQSITFTVSQAGVFYQADENPQWICSRLEIKALVRDNASENWGRLLEFEDADGRCHQWSMPMEMLKGSGEELRGELLRLGLEIAAGKRSRTLLIEYITTSKPEARARCVNHIGWHEQVFVLPDRTIGQSSETINYQAEIQAKDYRQSGTLADWQKHIASHCVDNSRLMLAVSCAFAALLLYPSSMESGGIHFVGESSTGKTTALRVAASVFGGADYVHRWRATTNGLEAIAALHSDTLLVLDELAQVDAKEAGEMAYLLANGSGKARAGKSGAARTRHHWRLLFLSAGEIGLAQHIRETGKRAKAGQQVRLVDVPADAGVGLGVFENLHGFTSGAALSQTLTEASSCYYGTAAIAFLERITQSDYFALLPALLKTRCNQFITANLPHSSSGQVHRICERFALIAAAGELATEQGLTSWSPYEAEHAAQICFNAWLQQRGGIVNQEHLTILAQVRSFFEAHAESRFSDWHAEVSHTINRAGFKKRGNPHTQFYVLPEAFRNEVCASFDVRSVSQLLLQAGWLTPDAQGNPYRREQLPGIGQSRCYVFTHKLWEE